VKDGGRRVVADCLLIAVKESALKIEKLLPAHALRKARQEPNKTAPARLSLSLEGVSARKLRAGLLTQLRGRAKTYRVTAADGLPNN
jgi:hypothetical protein